MLCFRCGSYNPENAQKCTVCGQGFVDEAGKAVGPPRRISQTAQPASIFVPGETVAGRYKIGELLGQGGVGAVYRARDLEIDVDVALKAITPNLLQTEEEQKNFSKQIKGARKLQHPNIVRIYDEGHEGARRFFTMKLLEGLTLRKIIRLRHEKGQPFTAEELVPIFHQLAAALEYAHKSTWHGDLKPENIIILPDLLKVTDFNLVKALPLKPFLGIAKSRSKGFPYIAPELRVEAQSIDGRVDIYALGVILAEMLTGLVFEGHYSRAMTAALEQLPTKLDGLVRKAVTEHPDGRFLRATDLARDLETALGSMTSPLPPPAKPPPPPGLAKPPVTAAAGPNLASTALETSGPQGPQGHGVQPPPPPAETGPSYNAIGGALAGPAPMVSSDDAAVGDADTDGLDMSGPPLEIGQSQVLLLQSGVTHPPEQLLEAARRLMAAGSGSDSGHSPDDTLDEGPNNPNAPAPSDIDTAPRGQPIPPSPKKGEIPVEPVRAQGSTASGPTAGRDGLLSSGERPRDPAALLDALYPNTDDNGLIPPPLPDSSEEMDKSASVDRPVRLSGDEDDENEETDERDIIAPRGQDDLVPAGEQPLAHADSQIHDALTALKPHPRELMDESVRPPEGSTGLAESQQSMKRVDVERVAADIQALNEIAAAQAETQSAERKQPVIATGGISQEATDRLNRKGEKRRPTQPPEDVDDDAVEAAQERSSPSLFRAEALPPPVVAPPPILRPVAPPRRKSGGSGPVIAVAAILGIVGLALVVVVWRFVLSDVKTGGPRDTGSDPVPVDHAVVTPGIPDELAALLDAGTLNGAAVADAGTVAMVAPLPPPVITKQPPPDASATTTKQPPDASAATTTKQPPPDATTTPDTTKPPDTATPPPATTPADATKPPDGTVVALAGATCPKAMKLIEGGTFTFGSMPNDDMRNFGEASAASTEVAPFCIEYYEQPNGKDSIPTTGISWQAAKNACERTGRRLCTEKEWERACKGPGSSRFPYGNSYDVEKCNTEDAAGQPRALAAASSFKGCRSDFKIFMMAGNAEEWVADSANSSGGGGQKIAKGGAADRPDFASRCSARRLLSPRATSGTLGFRCCADPKPQ